MSEQSASATPIILVTRKLPAAVEARLADRYDVRLNPDDALYTPEELAKKGHEIHWLEDWTALVGGAQGIEVDNETGAMMGGADPRRDGRAVPGNARQRVATGVAAPRQESRMDHHDDD